jgi:hypothetical protein
MTRDEALENKCHPGDPGTITTADGDVLNVGCENTDRELWRGPDEGGGDFYADSIFITKGGALGINCGGSVYVKPIRQWHRLAGGPISILNRDRQ